jgi:hypothetical protein
VSRVNNKFREKDQENKKQELSPAVPMLVWALFYGVVKTIIACQHLRPASGLVRY